MALATYNRLVLICLAALLFSVSPTAAQSLQLSTDVIEVGAQETPQRSALRPAESRVLGGGADCVNGDAVFHNVSNGFFPVTSGALELGQSFTATCDGALTDVVYLHQNLSDAVSPTTDVTLIVYNGAGTGGTVLGSQSFTIAKATLGFAEFVILTLHDPIPIASGSVYSVFLDLTAGNDEYHAESPGTYADGDLLITTNGDPASASVDASFDLRFFAFIEPPLVTVSTSVFDGPGWRHLGVPVGAVEVHDLAAINLVQGIPGGGGLPAQYPGAAPNLFTAYNGDGTYTSPAATNSLIGIGPGHFWYWYDNNAGPWPGGTSQSYELSSFTLEVTGWPFLVDGVLTQTQRADEFYLIANPFVDPLDATGIDVSNATLSTVFSAWDPSANTGSGGYVIIFKSNPGNGGMPDFIAPWQGLFAEMTTNPGVDPDFTFDVDVTDAGQTPPFYGRQSSAAVPYVHLVLSGVTETGSTVGDEAAYVRLLDDALVGWDRHDASNLPSFSSPSAGLASVGRRDGEAYRLSVNSLPSPDAETIETSVSFYTTERGQYELAWDGPSALPENWEAFLVDSEAGVTVDLRQETSYSFASMATDWSERFTLELVPASVVAIDPAVGLPDSFTLHTAFPNPFNPATTLRFDVPEASAVTIEVFDTLGRQVSLLADGPIEAGRHSIQWDAADVASGVYLVRMQAGDFTQAQRVTLLK